MSGMSMMLKSLGLDPDEIVSAITGLAEAAKAMNEKLDALVEHSKNVNQFMIDARAGVHEYLVALQPDETVVELADFVPPTENEEKENG